jgi:hypothetical protein
MTKPTKKMAITKKAAAKALHQTPAKRTVKKAAGKKAHSAGTLRGAGGRRTKVSDARPLPESVDEHTIARLVAEAESGIPAEKLRRRGRPAIGDEAASTYSVRIPDDLVTLVDGRSDIDGVTRGETIRRALIEYLTK